MTILRVSSRRASDKLKREAPGGTWLYPADMLTGGTFYELPADADADAALHIKGVSRPRDQERANYRKCW
jgi:hypothetical protein